MKFLDIILQEFRINMPSDGEGMGIPRKKMPQIKSKDYPEYFKYLNDKGVNFEKIEGVNAATLKPTQSEFSEVGVEKQLQKMLDKNDGYKPLIASSDDYIIDGHHRWVVAKNIRQPLTVFKADIPMKELMALTLKFPKVYFKDIYTEGYKLQLERDAEMLILNITDTKTGKRTEVRGKSGYESGNYDPDDKLHQLLDKIGKSANISDLINGDPVGINPKHPQGTSAKKATDVAFNENVSALASELEAKYNLKSLFLGDMASRNAIELHSIIVNREDQGKGTGSKVMQELIKYADDNGKIMVLDPGLLDKKHGTTSQSRLRKFYKQFGFIDNKGRNKNYEFRNLMIRYPQTNESTSLFNESKEMKISDLTISDAGLAIAQSAGGGSKTAAPLTVTKLPSGHVYLLNGYHRLVDAMKAGKDTVSVEFVPYEKVEILWKNEREEDIKYGKQFNESTVTEAFDNPYPFKLSGPSDSQGFSATAQTPNGALRMDIETTDYDNFGIDFAVGKSMGKTQAGDEFRVFATVVAMVKKWISVVGIEHVESFDFAANKDEHTSDGRARLYARFAKQLAGQLGWRLEQSTTANNSHAFFKLTNPKPVPRDDEYWYALEENVIESAGVGRVVKGVNTTVDVGPDEIIKQVKKYGNDVDRDGKPNKHLR